jgi:hypothetical protein
MTRTYVTVMPESSPTCSKHDWEHIADGYERKGFGLRYFEDLWKCKKCGEEVITERMSA